MRTAHDGGVCPVLDGAQHGVPELVYPHFYVADTGGFGDSPGDDTGVCAVVYPAAVQHFLDLLLPSHNEAECGIRRLGRPWARDKRRTHPAAAGHRGRRRHMVCDANNGAHRRNLRRRYDAKLHKTACVNSYPRQEIVGDFCMLSYALTFKEIFWQKNQENDIFLTTEFVEIELFNLVKLQK